jgi:CheY-specific phosphatase CheX
MSENLDYNQLARQYGLAPVPESVQRLTQLVASQNSDLDEIARVIAKDPALTKRLLRVASLEPDGSELPEEIVQSALMRSGMGCVLLLAMGTPLALALAKTFQTMLGIKLENVPPKSVPPLDSEHLLGTIGFSGKAVGRLYLRLSLGAAQFIAAGVLGLEPKELTDANAITDAVGELLNIITGNFKSNLCDAGLDCRLETPTVSRTLHFFTDPIPGGGLERMAFTSPQVTLFVDVTVNPWNED